MNFMQVAMRIGYEVNRDVSVLFAKEASQRMN